MKRSIARLGFILGVCLSSGNLQASLVISEIMANPVGLADSEGEWFELYNPTDRPFNLRDHWLGDDGGDLHRFETDLLLPPREYLTLARGPAPGFTPDYVYSRFALANGADEIVIGNAMGEILRFDYVDGFVLPGRSMEFVSEQAGDILFAATDERWMYASGDVGSPGSGRWAINETSVPEPDAAWLFALGLVAFAVARSIRRNQPNLAQSSSWIARPGFDSGVSTRVGV